ncbi:TetR/AcrR family transcriptional regulator [Caulobacter segnis]|nr:TetR/AcrR family transcriptional regulator [Caulobacter segnis]
MQQLASLSYAHTSMRDIAAAAGMNVSRLNYYFADKPDLIIFAVRHFKQTFGAKLAEAILPNSTVDAIIEILVQAATKDATMHRFWYDIRNQSLFDPTYHEIVREVVADLEALTVRVLRMINPQRDAIEILPLAGSMIDALFFHAVRMTLLGAADADVVMREQLTALARRYRDGS